MPRLISGSTLRTGGSGEFIDLKGAMPQLPASATTETGFTLATDSLLRTTYRSSLGYVEFNSATMYSALPEKTIRITGNGTLVLSTTTTTGNLVVEGGIGVGGNMHVHRDIVVNGITIGQGFREELDSRWNNLVIRGTASSSTFGNNLPNGQQSIAIGYSTLEGLETANRSVAIGRYALSSGTEIKTTVAIGDYALSQLGVVPPSLILPATAVVALPRVTITNVTTTSPVVVTTIDVHNLSTGSRISIDGVNGLVVGAASIVNSDSFYVDVLSTNTIALYTGFPLVPAAELDGTSATDYISSGTIVYPVEITVPGNDYVSGTRVKLTNFEFGGIEELDLAEYYYVLPLNSSTFQLYSDSILSEGIDGTGFATWTGGGGTSTRLILRSSNVAVGANAARSLYDGEKNFFFGYNIAPNLTTGSYNYFMGHEVATYLTKGSNNISIMGDNLVDGQDNQINIGAIFYYDGINNLDLSTNVELGLGLNTTATDNGALVVVGGVGVSADMRVGGTIYGTVTTATNIAGGNTGTIFYQTATGVTVALPIGAPGEVLLSNGSVPYWGAGGGGGSSTTASQALSVFVDVADSNTVHYLALNTQTSAFNTLTNDVSLTFDTTDGTLTTPKLDVTDTTASTSTFTNQAVVIDGGLGVQEYAFVGKSVYSVEGGQETEGYHLYTPRVTVSTTTPANPRIGDFWIDPNYGVELQYIQDGTDRYWIQFTGL